MLEVCKRSNVVDVIIYVIEWSGKTRVVKKRKFCRFCVNVTTRIHPADHAFSFSYQHEVLCELVWYCTWEAKFRRIEECASRLLHAEFAVNDVMFRWDRLRAQSRLWIIRNVSFKAKCLRHLRLEVFLLQCVSQQLLCCRFVVSWKTILQCKMVTLTCQMGNRKNELWSAIWHDWRQKILNVARTFSYQHERHDC